MRRNRTLRKKDRTGRSLFAGSLPDPKNMAPANPDNLHMDSSEEVLKPASHQVTSYEELARIYLMLAPLHPAHHTPEGLIVSDSHDWYPNYAHPDIITELRRMTSRLIVLDTETTGFRPEDGAQITEICWYSLNSGNGGTFLPPHTLDGADEAALAISRYSERIAGKPQDDGTQVRALHAFLGGDGTRTFLVGSNPAFDANHLNALFLKHGLPPSPWNHRLIDPCAASYWQNPDADLGSPTGLKEATAASRIRLEGHHAAKADVVATAEVWHTLENRRRLMPKMPNAL